jgi:DNA-binding response OmpR family regulator
MTVDILLGSTSGVDAARAIRAEFGSTPAILITAAPDQCEGFCPDAVFEKPFDPVKLAAAFRLIAPASQT